MKTLVLALALTAIGFTAAASDVRGVWMRNDGKTKVRIAPCGDALCGKIDWVKSAANAPVKVGTPVFTDMKLSKPGTWVGEAFNPEDGKTYAGKFIVNGDALETKGCALGGLICKSMNWTRSE